MTAHHPAALPKGHRIGEYEIVRVLGAGGFGITYLAFDHQLDGPVALKEYFPVEAASRGPGWGVAPSTTESQALFAWGLDRFIDEARSLHRLRHPNVVRAHRYIQAHSTAYIVMEYVEGASLQQVLRVRDRQTPDAAGRLTPDAWRRWLDPLLDGLAHVHGHGYLHRDIKPANIMIRAADATPVLIDFGAARAAARDRTHTQVLTPGYAPLEQYSREGTQGPPTDIYALAAVSYRVLTGARLSSAPDRVLDDDYAPLANRIAGADRRWLAAIDHGLALRPEDRPQTVRAWTAAMRGAPATPAPHVAPEARQAAPPAGPPHRDGTIQPPPATSGRSPSVAVHTDSLFWWVLGLVNAVIFSFFIITSDPPDRSPASASDESDQSTAAPDDAMPYDYLASGDRVVREPRDYLAGGDRVVREPRDYLAGLQTDDIYDSTPQPERSIWNNPFSEFGKGLWSSLTSGNVEMLGGAGQPQRSSATAPPIRPTTQAPTRRSDPPNRNPASVSGGNDEDDRSAGRPRRPGPSEPPTRVPPRAPATRSAPRSPPVSSSEADEARLGLNRSARRVVQRGLRVAGFDPGSVDGLFGPATRASLRAWQTSRGKAATGYLTLPQAAELFESARQRQPRPTASVPADRTAAPAPTTGSPAYFTRGSTEDDVLRLQGTPTSVSRYPTLGYERWSYARSTVDISTRSRQVLQWSNRGNLKVRQAPAGR